MLINTRDRLPDAWAEHVVFMEKLSAREYIVRPGQDPRPLLNGIDLLVRRAEAWGFMAESSLEIKLLLEIMANIRTYAGGRCVLLEHGMPRHKRVILKHVFYIGDSDMIYPNMNVLEYLMLVTAYTKRDALERQDEIFEHLLAAGLGYLALTANELLSAAEKAVVQLVAAAYSDSRIIIFNLPEYEFDTTLVHAIANISRFVRAGGKTLIIGTHNSALVEQACSHTVVLKDGRVLYDGPVQSFCQMYDRVEVIVRNQDIDAVERALAPVLAGFTLTVKNDSLLISYYGEGEADPGLIYRKIAGSGLVPEQLQINRKNVQNAYEELMRRHDLQEQLLQ